MEARRSLSRRLSPFVAGALLGFVVVPIANHVDWLTYAIAAALAGAVFVVALWFPWSRHPRVPRIALPLAFLVAMALLRDSGGGNLSGVGSLALLPVFWLALHGSRRQLAALVVALWAFFLAPTLLIGGAAYPATGWRSSLVTAVVAAIIGFTTQRLVARERAHVDDLAHRERDMERVIALSRELLHADDARERICDAVCALGGGYFAFLLELDADGDLATTAASGLELPAMKIAPSRPSWLASAFASGVTEFGDPRERSGRHPDMYEAAGRPSTVLAEPVRDGDVVIAVLVTGWHEFPADAARVTGVVRMLATEAAFAIERADLLGRLTAIAATDALTGLPNRRSWDEHLAVAMERDDRFCVAVIDIDFFKAFNDARGHQAGDRLLEDAAAAWRQELRPTDVLARYGGEEFVVMLPGCDVEAARPVIERLRAATPQGQSCSAGVAARRTGEDGAALVRRADEALYAAKRGGRDQQIAA